MIRVGNASVEIGRSVCGLSKSITRTRVQEIISDKKIAVDSREIVQCRH